MLISTPIVLLMTVFLLVTDIQMAPQETTTTAKVSMDSKVIFLQIQR